jgi:hypothetical protein
MAFFYGILAVIGWVWFAIVVACLEREIVRGSGTADERG